MGIILNQWCCSINMVSVRNVLGSFSAILAHSFLPSFLNYHAASLSSCITNQAKLVSPLEPWYNFHQERFLLNLLHLDNLLMIRWRNMWHGVSCGEVLHSNKEIQLCSKNIAIHHLCAYVPWTSLEITRLFHKDNDIFFLHTWIILALDYFTLMYMFPPKNLFTF